MAAVAPLEMLRWLRLLLAWRAVEAVVFSPQVDAEIAELHASIEELWQRLGSLAEEMHEAGKLSSGEESQLLEQFRKLQEDFIQLQQQAYQIGEDSADNAALARHPLVDAYVEYLRAFQPRLQAMVSLIEKEYSRLMVKPLDQRKEELRREKFCGASLLTLRAKAKKRLARDTRNFKTKAMDELTIFRERQLEMQDKQRDMLARMEGPDWPRLDWPLSNADARHVGDAEDIIHSGIDSLKARLAPKDIPYLHESQDQEALEALVATGDMMVCYSKLMDRYVEKVKKSQKAKKVIAREEVRSSLKSFGKATASARPFAWLHGLAAGGAGDGRPGAGGAGLSSGLGGLAQLGSSLGGLAPAEGDGLEGPDESGPEEVRWSAAQPVYNDFEL